MIFLIPVIGLLCTTLILFWLYPNQVKTGKLSDLYSADSVRTLAGLDPKSLDYKLLAAGLKLRPVTFRLLCGAAGLAGMAVMWVFLPGLPALVVGGIAFYVPNAWLDDKVKSRGRMIDQQLPIAIGRISAGLLAGGSVPDVLQQVGESLALEKNNPLTPELILTATEMRVKDRTGCSAQPGRPVAFRFAGQSGAAAGRFYRSRRALLYPGLDGYLYPRPANSDGPQPGAGQGRGFSGISQGFTGGAGVDPGLPQFRPNGARITHPTPGADRDWPGHGCYGGRLPYHSLDDHGGSLNASLDTPHRDRQFCLGDLPDPGMGAQHPHRPAG